MAPVADLVRDLAFCLTLAADPVAVREGLARIAASAPLAALSAVHRATAEIVLAEVLNNVAEHAYFGLPGDISINLMATAVGLECRIADHGREVPGGSPPAGTLPQEDFPEGGFGWHLIRSLTHGLDYQRKNGRNLLRFVIPA